jgi:hypothetical protein
MIKARINQLSNSTEALLNAVRTWAESTDSYMTKEFEDAVNTLVHTYESEAVPPVMRPFVALVQTIGEEWDAWAKAVSHKANPNEMPAKPFWDATRTLADLHGQTNYKRTARPQFTIEQLTEQGVNDEQMCRYFGFEDDKGAQMWKIKEEKQEPGKHLNESYVPPQQRLFDEEYKAHRIKIDYLIEKLEQKTGAGGEPEPQAVESLLDQNVSLGQIMLICRLDESQVREECERLGREVPLMHYDTKSSHFDPEMSDIQQRLVDSIGTTGADAYYEEPVSESDEPMPVNPDPNADTTESMVVLDTDGNPLSMESQIILLHQAGMADGDIATQLANDEYPVSHQRVNGVIRRWKRDPSQFSVPVLG